MTPKRTAADAARQAQLSAELRRDQELRQKSYRERALKLFPHVCARCGRELSGKRLRELTVHHRDHDHNNNPNDGGNWELLCLYCHDHEHEKYRMAGHGDGSDSGNAPSLPALSNPFNGLDALLKPKGDQAEPEKEKADKP
jgi:hypothetical protein